MNPPQTSAAPETQDRIRGLLEQREQLSGWLERLRDVEDDETPARIAERVRADYVARLEALTDELGGHQETLEAQLAELRSELERAQSASADAADALSEARLRYRIGELDDRRWEERHPELEQAADAAAREAEEAGERVGSLAELVGEIGGGGALAEVSEVPEASSEAPIAGGDELPSTEELGWLTDATVLSPDPAAETDLAFLQTLEDQTIESPAPPDADAVWAAEEATGGEAPGDDMAFLEELDRAIAASLVSGPAEEEEATAPPPGEWPAASPEPEAGPEPVSCRECGAENDAQAWYCEICGSEL
ncbi:hypothetical protein BH23GEM4_BH23GEM4_15970 [soil metagenome]